MLKYLFLLLFFWGVFQPETLHAQSTATTKNKAAAVKSGKANKSKRTMTQTPDGKWVIVDSQKTTLYDVFIYDNGPDYAAEGLIRVVKNGKIGYVNAKTYVLVIEPQFDCAYPFENGKAKVSKNCKTIKDGEYSVWESNDWKFVDKKGRY